VQDEGILSDNKQDDQLPVKKTTLPFSSLMEITGDFEEGSKRLAEEYYEAVKRSGEILFEALRD
jgi:hypothetical protein